MVPHLDTLNDYVERGLLTAREHRGLTIYNYTARVQFERLWDDITCACRGLILASDGQVIARPWSKFFNLGEEAAPSQRPDEVTIKLDGALGILYAHPDDGRSYLSTRGMMTSPQADAANGMWDHSIQPPDDWTVMAEIIHPSSRVVVAYDFEGLVLLGARRTSDGAEVPRGAVEDWARAVGLPMVERVESDLPSLVARAATLDPQREGFVCRWGDTRLKIKGEAYKRAHKRLAGFNERSVADAWYAGDTAWCWNLPDELMELAKTWLRSLTEAETALRTEVEAAAQRVQTCSTRKEAAMRLKAEVPRLLPLVMELAYDRRQPDYRVVVYRTRFGNYPRPTEG